MYPPATCMENTGCFAVTTVCTLITTIAAVTQGGGQVNSVSLASSSALPFYFCSPTVFAHHSQLNLTPDPICT